MVKGLRGGFSIWVALCLGGLRGARAVHELQTATPVVGLRGSNATERSRFMRAACIGRNRGVLVHGSVRVKGLRV